MTPRIRRYSALFSMLALVVGLALPAAAQESTDRGATLNLGLAELYAAGHLRLELDPVTPASGAAIAAEVSENGGLQPATAWRYAERAELLQVQIAPKERRFGKWLKKHWYIPAIAAAAIGVVVLDDDGEDPNDPED